MNTLVEIKIVCNPSGPTMRLGHINGSGWLTGIPLVEDNPGRSAAFRRGGDGISIATFHPLQAAQAVTGYLGRFPSMAEKLTHLEFVPTHNDKD